MRATTFLSPRTPTILRINTSVLSTILFPRNINNHNEIKHRKKYLPNRFQLLYIYLFIFSPNPHMSLSNVRYELERDKRRRQIWIIRLLRNLPVEMLEGAVLQLLECVSWNFRRFKEKKFGSSILWIDQLLLTNQKRISYLKLKSIYLFESRI